MRTHDEYTHKELVERCNALLDRVRERQVTGSTYCRMNRQDLTECKDIVAVFTDLLDGEGFLDDD